MGLFYFLRLLGFFFGRAVTDARCSMLLPGSVGGGSLRSQHHQVFPPQRCAMFPAACREPLTALPVGEDQGVGAAARDLNHSGLQRLGEGQRHRGRLQREVVALI